jgi:hypothetical protein
MTSKNFDWLQKGTFEMLDLWMYNFARNVSEILDGYSVRKLGKFTTLVNSELKFSPKDSAIVIGAGPSIDENNHLDLIKNSNFQGTIVCTDRMLIPCLKNGITPKKFPNFYVITIDPVQRITKYYNDPIVKKFGKKIHTSLSTCTSPDVVSICKKFGIKIHWFHPLIDNYKKSTSINKLMNMMSKSMKNPKGFPGLQTGGNVGTAAWVFSWAVLGKSPVALIGINFGYNENTNIIDTPHYNEFIKISNGEHNKAKKYYKTISNPYTKSKILVDSIFDYYREAFCNLVTLTPIWVRTINATQGGSLFGKRIELETLEKFLLNYSK